MQAVRGYWEDVRGTVEEEYLTMYPGGLIWLNSPGGIDYERCVYCGGVNWPPNHPGGVALIK